MSHCQEFHTCCKYEKLLLRASLNTIQVKYHGTLRRLSHLDETCGLARVLSPHELVGADGEACDAEYDPFHDRLKIAEGGAAVDVDRELHTQRCGGGGKERGRRAGVGTVVSTRARVYAVRVVDHTHSSTHKYILEHNTYLRTFPYTHTHIRALLLEPEFSQSHTHYTHTTQ